MGGGRLAQAARRFAVAALVALLATAGLGGSSGASPAASSRTAALVELVVSTQPGADPANAARSVGASVVRAVENRPDLVVVRVPADRSGELTHRLAARADVEFAAPNAVARMAAATNDPLLARQWHLLERAKSAGSSNWVPVGSPTLGSGAVVAVLDTGVTAHADIDGLLPGRDFVSNDSDASDSHGHGTHVAGSVAESAGNGLGAAGVAPGASVLPLRVLDDSGNAPYDRIFAAMAYAVEAGVDVINLSLAGPVDAGICDAVTRAVAAGVVVVAAAGNDAGPVAYPAACPDAIGVGAVTMVGLVASYSNRGVALDISAPGGEADVDLDLDGNPDGVLQYAVFNGRPGYYYSAGTSMASPHVAGAAAIVRSIRPGSTPAQVRHVLVSTATDRGTEGSDPIYGAGVLDVTAVVSAAHALPVETAPAPAPSPEPAPAPSPEPAPSPAPEPEPEAPGPAEQPSAEQPPAEQPPAEEAPADESAAVVRLAGAERYATAASVSVDAFPAGADHVWIATGSSYADALSSAAAAGRRTGPLLLVEPCGMPQATASELTRLSPSAVTVIGGPAAVCDGVLTHVRSLTGVEPSRLSGADRFETAAAVAQAHWSGGARSVVLASGAGFADSLSGGPVAAAADGPLLLTASCALPGPTASELQRLRPARIQVMGGPGAVCEAVVEQARSLTGAEVVRVAGADRYATASAGSAAAWSNGAEVVYVASGANFADGLAAGAAAAAAGSPLLLVPSCGELPGSVGAELDRLDPSRTLVVGGNAAVCQDMLHQLSLS